MMDLNSDKIVVPANSSAERNVTSNYVRNMSSTGDLKISIDDKSPVIFNQGIGYPREFKKIRLINENAVDVTVTVNFGETDDGRATIAGNVQVINQPATELEVKFGGVDNADLFSIGSKAAMRVYESNINALNNGFKESDLTDIRFRNYQPFKHISALATYAEANNSTITITNVSGIIIRSAGFVAAASSDSYVGAGTGRLITSLGASAGSGYDAMNHIEHYYLAPGVDLVLSDDRAGSSRAYAFYEEL